jgi:hypothetical protein
MSKVVWFLCLYPLAYQGVWSVRIRDHSDTHERRERKENEEVQRGLTLWGQGAKPLQDAIRWTLYPPVFGRGIKFATNLQSYLHYNNFLNGGFYYPKISGCVPVNSRYNLPSGNSTESIF